MSHEPLIIVKEKRKPNYRVALAIVIKNNFTQILVDIHLFYKYIYTQQHNNKQHIYSYYDERLSVTPHSQKKYMYCGIIFHTYSTEKKSRAQRYSLFSLSATEQFDVTCWCLK